MRNRTLFWVMMVVLSTWGIRGHAQSLGIVLSAPDQTGYVGGPLISFDATVTNLTGGVVDVQASDLTSNNYGRAGFNALSDVNDNFSPFSLGAGESVLITDLFDFTVNPTSVSPTPLRSLNPVYDYAFGSYQLSGSDLAAGSVNFTVRLENVPGATPEPGVNLLVAAMLLSLSVPYIRERKSLRAASLFTK